MMKFNREEGLTLIELLITIAVLAIVAAIAVPAITNVVNSTEDRAVAQSTNDILAFVDEYDKVGGVSFDSATQTFTGYVDVNGDGSATENEKIEELVIDSSVFTVEQFGDADFDPATPDAFGPSFSDINYIAQAVVDAGFHPGPAGVDASVIYGDNGDVADYGITDWRVVEAN